MTARAYGLAHDASLLSSPNLFNLEKGMPAAFIPIWILGAGAIGLLVLSRQFAKGHVIIGGYVTGVDPLEVRNTGQPYARPDAF